MVSKSVFWQALLSVILIFGVGILLGVSFEDARSRDVELNLLKSEINVLDSQLMGRISEGNIDFDCEIAKDKLVQFADEIFLEAKQLEKYDDSSDLTDTLLVLHRRYDILRTMLWLNAIEINEKCGRDFHVLVYVYQYIEPPVSVKSNQITFSRVLSDLKDKYGNDIVLIPIAGDMGLSSVDILKETYSVETYPSIIVNEEYVVDDLEELGELENSLF